MALFVDGPACTIDDLIDEDSGLLATAQTVSINVTAKLRLAMSEVQSELERLLLRLQSTTAFGLIQPPGIGQVVLTPDLARWEKMQALAMVYRDASFTQLVDRYQKKCDLFVALTRAARDQFVANGVGLVNDPVPKAPLPVLGTESTLSVHAAGTYYTCVTWMNAAGQEGSPSDPASIAISAGQRITVMVSPAGTPTGGPVNAAGFNVYAGTALAMMTLQNSAPLSANETFTYVPGTSFSSQIAGTGQIPDYVKPLPATTSRG